MSMDPSPFHGKNPFEVLGLQGTEDAAAIRKAFLRIAAQSHPDRLRMKSEEEKAQALETFLLAKKAFEVLSQPDKRREWSERLAREAAPRTPAAPVLTPTLATPTVPRPGVPVSPPSRGVPLTRSGPSLTPALGTPIAPMAHPPRTPVAPIQPPASEAKAPSPSRGPLPAAAALQLYKLGMLALESSDYAKALDLFSKAAKLAPTPRHQAMELVGRGHQYLSTRFLERARESFERALQLQPDCREARMGLELLEKQSGRSLKGR
jgi:tetratricopeptide (TPR) repeat protein